MQATAVDDNGNGIAANSELQQELVQRANETETSQPSSAQNHLALGSQWAPIMPVQQFQTPAVSMLNRNPLFAVGGTNIIVDPQNYQPPQAKTLKRRGKDKQADKRTRRCWLCRNYGTAAEKDAATDC